MVAHPYPTPQRALVVWPVGLRAGGGGGVGLDDQLVAGFNIIFGEWVRALFFEGPGAVDLQCCTVQQMLLGVEAWRLPMSYRGVQPGRSACLHP
jgi:hypothetical protein